VEAARARAGKRIALISIAASGTLALAKILLGWMAGSTSVVADGFESVGDVVASGMVLFGLTVASRPPDENHPYGHGRFETLAGLAVGIILGLGGVGICVRSLEMLGSRHVAPEAYAIWPLIASAVAKSVLSTLKFRFGRRIQSDALVADAWNDTVDILSALSALTALGLTLSDPSRFLDADHWGGFAVGLIVIFTGLRIIRETSLQLMDTMPDPAVINRIREVAMQVAGVDGIEKVYARKTGFQYHVDLHLEVNPAITVRASHQIAHDVQARVRKELDFIADVLVHVVPAPARVGTDAAGPAVH
jgi:cation diffusion facilitator family transporter